MEKKLAELKADEISDLKRYVFFTVETINFAFCKIVLNVDHQTSTSFFSHKRKKKKLLKEQRKKRERVELKMDLPGVSIADGNDTSMFSLSTIKKAQVRNHNLRSRPNRHTSHSPDVFRVNEIKLQSVTFP